MCRAYLRLLVAASVLFHGMYAALAENGISNAPGITDTEIKIGQTMPYSGPASAYSSIGRAEIAYFRMINEEGGVGGRKINLISLDDGYSPPKAIEQTRRLVEEDQVAFIFGTLGTPTNIAIRRYLNEHNIPQLFITSGSSQLNDPKHFPWTMPLVPPNYRIEGSIYGQYILTSNPSAKVAVLYQDDDLGKDLLYGLKDGLGAQADERVVATAGYEITDSNIDSQILTLRASGADTLLTAATPKFAAQSIRMVHDIGWNPTHFVDDTGAAISAVLIPAGLQNAVGLISTIFQKDPADPEWKNDPAYIDWLAWMKRYNPGADIADSYNVVGYSSAMLLVKVLEQCGNDLSRKCIMIRAANLHNVTLPMLLPGMVINTSEMDFAPVREMRLVRFNGSTWVPFGGLISSP